MSSEREPDAELILEIEQERLNREILHLLMENDVQPKAAIALLTKVASQIMFVGGIEKIEQEHQFYTVTTEITGIKDEENGEA